MGTITHFCSLLIFFISIIDIESSVFAAVLPPSSHAHNFGIYGGTPIKITEVPFMAILRPKSSTYYCGASIIGEQFLITAAHCVINKNPSIFKVTVGTDNAVEGGEDYEPEKFFPHPNYNRATVSYDIAVVKLSKKMVFSDKVKPIKMATSSPKDGEILDTMGFGRTEHNDEPSKDLLAVKVPFVNRKKCAEALKNSKITDQMLCAGGEAGKDACGGDSGGPIRYKGELIGATSWGIGCGESGYPGVYAYLPSMRDFIDDVIKKNS